MTDEPTEAPEILIQPEQMAGFWANFAQVSHSPYEFTLDFVRMEFSPPRPRGIVVARVSMSPLFITQLISALQTNWHIYEQKAMPPEVYFDAQQVPDQGEAEASSASAVADDDTDNDEAGDD